MPVTILLVDDDRDSRFLAEHSLRECFRNCSILACKSMDEAVTKLEGARIDAIVTDNNLGPRSGCEFIRHVRRKGLTCPVIMVTCSNNPEVAEAAYSAGVTKIFGAYDEVFTEFLKRQLEQSVSKADRGKISSGQP